MSRRRYAYGLIACGLMLVPFGWSVVPAGSQPKGKDQPGALEIREGRQVSWAGWRFNWAIHPRNGLVLENVFFKDKSVLKYAGMAEVFMAYNKGDFRPHDFGGGIGSRMVDLFPGKDCVPGALSCSAWNGEGKAEGKRLVMMHEEATGLSYIGNMGRAYGKTLVIWGAYNMGGYYYIHRWKFRDDGALIPEVGLTGPLQHISKGDPNEYGSLVGKNKVFAPSHVHNIYFCLDFDIDGTENTVEEFNYQQDAPGSISAKTSWTPLKKETGRPTSAENFRFWRVVNHNSKNNLGLPRSYDLLPGGNGKFYGTDKEKFAHAQMWVTKHHPKEHPTDTKALATILPSYLNNEDIENQNVVVWYVLNIHHIPRTEDWPGMPVEWASFMLKPRDFLDVSPVSPK